MMRQYAVRRGHRTAILWMMLGAALPLGLPAAAQEQVPAPIERRTPAEHTVAPGAAGQGNGGLRRGARGEHLAEWMNQHSNLSPEEQQRALEREPGFHSLPEPQQQRMRDRLAQLDAMTPEQRQRHLAHIETMERLNPEQRAQVRGVMAQLGTLPLNERRTVAQTFRSLRELPPEQRVQAYASGRYGPALSDTDRTVLFNLLRVEPMLATGPGANPGPGPAPHQP